jgi:hypothetical protein
MVRSAALLVALLVSSSRALAEPITLTFDGLLPQFDYSDGSVKEYYEGVFFWGLGRASPIGTNGVLFTESDLAIIFLTASGTAPYNDPEWVGHRFDFIGIEAATSSGQSPGQTRRLTAEGYRNLERVGSVTAEFGDSLTWFDVGLEDIDMVILTDDTDPVDGICPFCQVGFNFDDFTYETPEPRSAILLALIALGARRFRSARDRPVRPGRYSGAGTSQRATRPTGHEAFATNCS